MKKNAKGMGFAIPTAGAGKVTARMAGDVTDLELCVSPELVEARIALRHMAKAINLALKSDYIESALDGMYHASRVKGDSVYIQHADYFGLGDGLMASLGRATKSFTLTLKGPDPGSPEGKKWIAENGGGAIGGIFNLVGRKLNLLQEFEDKVPTYVEQMLDRLEAKKIVTHWNRDEWEIQTTVVGMDVVMRPAIQNAAERTSTKKHVKKTAKKAKPATKKSVANSSRTASKASVAGKANKSKVSKKIAATKRKKK